MPLSPEILEPVGRHFGVAHRVLDVLMPEVVLQGSGVVTIIGKLKPAGVSEHVGCALNGILAASRSLRMR